MRAVDLKKARLNRTEEVFPIILLVGLVFLIGSGFWYISRQNADHSKKQISETLEQAVGILKRRLNEDRDYFLLLANTMANKTFSRENYQQNTARFAKDHPGLINIAWADQDYFLRWVSPYEPNKHIVGLKLLLPEPKRASHLAFMTRQPAYTKPFTVIQGKPAVEIYVPIFAGDEFGGTVSGVYSISNLLKSMLPKAIRSTYAVSVINAQGHHVANVGMELPAGEKQLSHRMPFDPLGHGVELSLSTVPKSLPKEFMMAAIVALVFSSLLAWSISRQRMEINARRQAQASLVLAKLEADAANDVKSQFLGHISHELRTPLNAIIGFSDVIANERMGRLENATYREYVNDIGKSGERLLGIVNDLLDVSRIEAGKMEINEAPTDINSAIKDVVSEFDHPAKTKSTHLITECFSDLPMVLVDEDRVKQLVSNLIDNSLKFTRSGGTIQVKSDVIAGNRVRITVSDTGVGIPNEKLKEIFEPFGQVLNSHVGNKSGVGLGLYIVKKIIDIHEAEIFVESEEGIGTVTTVTFPAIRSLDDVIPLANTADRA